MAKKVVSALGTSRAKQQAPAVEWKFPLDKSNFLMFIVGIGVVILGFALMSTGITSDPAKHQEAWASPLVISVAPVLLIIGYCVVVPLAIMRKNSPKS